MTRSASHASIEKSPDAYDFNRNYKYLKALIEQLKRENSESVRREIFGEADRDRSLTKTQMKQLFRFLRRVEKHYEACTKPPIPPELEASIRSRDSEEWLPWEMEAIEKVEVWREQLHQRRTKAREMLNVALDRVRSGADLP
jgi:hypothetical protein